MKYALIYLAVFFLLGQCALAQKSESGSEEILLGVEFRSEAIAFVAQRSKRTADFAVQVTFADGRPPQQCLATPDFAKKLEGVMSFLELREDRQDQAESEFPVFVGLFSFRTDWGMNAQATIQADSQGQRIAMIHNGKAIELVRRAADFAIFAEGCEVFGRK